MEQNNNSSDRRFRQQGRYGRGKDDSFSIDDMNSYPGNLPYEAGKSQQKTETSGKFVYNYGSERYAGNIPSQEQETPVENSENTHRETASSETSDVKADAAADKAVISDDPVEQNQSDEDLYQPLNEPQNNGTDNSGKISEKPRHKSRIPLLIIILLLAVCALAGYMYSVNKKNDKGTTVAEVVNRAKQNTEDYNYGISAPPQNTQEVNNPTTEEKEEPQAPAEQQPVAAPAPPKVEKKASTIDKKPKAPKKIQPAVQAKTIQKQKITAQSKAAATTPQTAPAGNTIFAIQLFSSPNKDEAYRVRDEAGSGAYISTLIINSKVWYRVRFGHYPSKEEASAAAKAKGFSKYWIDRVL